MNEDGSGSDSLLSTLLTSEHQVTIAVTAVAIAFAAIVLLRGGSHADDEGVREGVGGGSDVATIKETKSSDLPVVETSVEESPGAATAEVSSGTKKKKKKKKKAATAAPAAAPAPTEQPDNASKNGKKKAKKASPAPAAPPKAKTPSQTPQKPKSTKNSKVSFTNWADSSSDSEDSDKPKENKNPVIPRAKPKPTATLPLSLTKRQQQAMEDDGWVIADTTSKKRSNKKKPTPAATTQNPSAAAATKDTKLTVSVPAKKVGIVIGPKGTTLQSLQDKFLTKIDVSSAPNPSDPALVSITGPHPPNVALCQQAVTELATKGYASLLQTEDFTEQGISVHPRVLSEIVGVKGSVIRSLQDTFSVKVTIPHTDWKPSDPAYAKVANVRVGLAGTKADCAKAKQALQSIVRYHHHSSTHPGLVHREVPGIPPEAYHAIIGPKGSEIRHIRGNYQCDVYMPSEESYCQEILVVGRPEKVAKAVIHVERLAGWALEAKERTYDDDYY
eukprot:CAMPEP_0172483544 /NCGR_PEP_ID=MMETSP1066-20121228/10538_1 /TAXON_ID=671091 /ORGANISM="Coscinodiscus wailesii, Strain CCMP2513" /LENGTH=500 /DNA_ID=CAMNT_0013247455 /DNA_START=97 /DNA_END=1599 /DNA_ORIENTATION=+